MKFSQPAKLVAFVSKPPKGITSEDCLHTTSDVSTQRAPENPYNFVQLKKRTKKSC